MGLTLGFSLQAMVLREYFKRHEKTPPYDVSSEKAVIGLTGVGNELIEELFAMPHGLDPALEDAIENFTKEKKARAAKIEVCQGLKRANPPLVCAHSPVDLLLHGYEEDERVRLAGEGMPLQRLSAMHASRVTHARASPDTGSRLRGEKICMLDTTLTPAAMSIP